MPRKSRNFIFSIFTEDAGNWKHLTLPLAYVDEVYGQDFLCDTFLSPEIRMVRYAAQWNHCSTMKFHSQLKGDATEVFKLLKFIIELKYCIQWWKV